MGGVGFSYGAEGSAASVWAKCGSQECTAGGVEHGAYIVGAHNLLQVLIVDVSIELEVLEGGATKQVDSNLGHLSHLPFEGHLGENLLHGFLHVTVGGDKQSSLRRNSSGQ